MFRKIPLAYNMQVSRKYPVSLVHFVTNRCNARCSFCFIDFDNPETFKNELTVKEIAKITKNLGPYLMNVNLTGGEPFARKDIYLPVPGFTFLPTSPSASFIIL